MDHPFTMEDAEELLRRYDVDAKSLHRRLRRLAPSLWGDATPDERRRQGLVTAESYDLPVGAFIPTKQIRDAMEANNIRPTGNQIVDLVTYKIISEGLATPALIANSLPQLLSPQLVRGERMDVNRIWANGRDDNGNGIVDELQEVWHDDDLDGVVDPNEVTPSEYVWWQSPGVAPGRLRAIHRRGAELRKRPRPELRRHATTSPTR